MVDPAHAGMILIDGIAVGAVTGGPRACGDDPDESPEWTIDYEWTPRMRG